MASSVLWGMFLLPASHFLINPLLCISSTSSLHVIRLAAFSRSLCVHRKTAQKLKCDLWLRPVSAQTAGNSSHLRKCNRNAKQRVAQVHKKKPQAALFAVVPAPKQGFEDPKNDMRMCQGGRSFTREGGKCDFNIIDIRRVLIPAVTPNTLNIYSLSH